MDLLAFGTDGRSGALKLTDWLTGLNNDNDDADFHPTAQCCCAETAIQLQHRQRPQSIKHGNPFGRQLHIASSIRKTGWH